MEIIRGRRDSGLCVEEYCRINGISRHAYYYWQRKLRKGACAGFEGQDNKGASVPVGWMQLSPPRQERQAITIEINDCRVNVEADTSPELLKKVCSILRELK